MDEIGQSAGAQQPNTDLRHYRSVNTAYSIRAGAGGALRSTIRAPLREFTLLDLTDAHQVWGRPRIIDRGRTVHRCPIPSLMNVAAAS